ncbi:MAG: GNAT family N-acetyltransferase [Gammaproteobacteria bacterium]|nr:GNAT family N-acetyltransferase [Gammaproteobacteria bacterium]
MQLTDVCPADLDAVLALNEASVPHVNSIDLEQMRWFAENAFFFKIASIDGRLAGFLIGLRPGLNYGSENYRWFSEHYAEFGYVDRVAVDESARRFGVASRLYDDFAALLRGKVDHMTCEVNIRPPNESSMRYHETHGFTQVATQETEDGAKKVALMEKKL